MHQAVGMLKIPQNIIGTHLKKKLYNSPRVRTDLVHPGPPVGPSLNHCLQRLPAPSPSLKQQSVPLNLFDSVQK